MSALLDEPPRWERQPGEPDRAYIMFLAYRDMGLGRSLRKLCAAEIGNAPAKQVAGNVKKWSSAWNWPARALAWDAMLAAERSAEVYAERVRFADFQVRVAWLALSKAAAAIQNVELSELTPNQAVAMADAAIKWGRLALSMDSASDEIQVEQDVLDFETPESSELARQYSRAIALERERRNGEPARG
jgi:hypothetical protein